MCSTPSLPLLPGPFLLEVVITARVPSRGLIDLLENYLCLIGGKKPSLEIMR